MLHVNTISRYAAVFFLIVACCRPVAGQADSTFSYVSSYVQVPGNLVLSADSSVQVANRMRGFGLFLPASGTVKGVVCFFMGHAVTPDMGIDELSIVEPAMKKDIAVAFVSTGNLVEFLFHESAYKILDSVFSEMITTHNLPRNRWLFGGLSLGGTRAMKYATRCLSNGVSSPVVPAGLVLCDAPLDFIRFWGSTMKMLDVDFHANATGEARWVSYYMASELGGTAEEHPQAFIDYSPFCYAAPNAELARLFSDFPVRAYHEPDVNWWIDTRRKDYYNMNSIDLAALINFLVQSGNARAELMTTHQQRKKPLSENSPHSWSIVDNLELVEWFEDVLSRQEDDN